MPKIIASFTGEGFKASATEYENGMVEFLADADIDADGANGQSGKRAAYMVADKGSEALANGGMGFVDGKVIGVKSWFKDIVILGPDGQPKVFPGGIIGSRTSYVRHIPGTDKPMPADDPAAYIDSEMIPYMVVPPIIIQKTRGAVMGCRCLATNIKTGKTSEGIVADIGPRNKVGEVSIQMARELGIPESPRWGGAVSPIIKYQLWPGEPSTRTGVAVRLRWSSGKYI